MAYTAEISINNKTTYPVKVVLENGLMIFQISFYDAQRLINLLMELMSDKYICLDSLGTEFDVKWRSSFSVVMNDYNSGMKYNLSTMQARELGRLIKEKIVEFDATDKKECFEPDEIDGIRKRTDDNLRGVFE